jgi:hypothetical protein
MFKNYKVFYSPNDNPSTTGSPSTGGDIEPVSPGPTDRDILKDDDDAISEDESDEEADVSDEDDEGESLSEDEDGSDSSESEEGEESDESEEGSDDADDEESDGTGDEGLEELAQSDLTKAIKKISPNLFKKVPGLREALERDKQFGEVFSNPEEAKQAARNSFFLEAMYKDISSGDVEKTGNFLKALKNTDESKFEDFSHTILESIGKLNPQLYGEVMLKPMKKALMSMYSDALRTGNKNLAAVAIHAHNYWFDTQDIKAPLEDRKPKPTKSKEQEQWEQEKTEFEQTKAQEFRGGITEVVNHSMKLSITKELDGIKLDEYKKRNIIRDIFLGVDEVLGSDKRYLGGINSLFDQAKSSKYTPDWKSRIVKAYLQRARQALPAIRNKVLREAGIKFNGSQKSESRRMVPAGLGGNKSEAGIDFSRVDRSKTTDMDILNGKPKYIK